jgi:hypothetical protein
MVKQKQVKTAPAESETDTFNRKAAVLGVLATATKEERTSQQAAMFISSEFAAYRTIIATEGTTSVGEELDVPALMEQLKQQAAAVNSGDFGGPIAMLLNQAVTLQSMFTRLTEKALAQSHMPNLESYFRLALKAQSQCRATLETMAAIKNPPVIYARQANVTTGPQQINNNAAPFTHMRDIENEQNQLLEECHERLDTRTPSINVRDGEAVEALGESQRAGNTGR